MVAGGYSYDKVLSSCEIFNFSRRSWSYGAEMAQGVGNAAFTSYNNELYVSCGQYSEHGVYTSDKIQKFNIFSNQWCIITRYISPGESLLFINSYHDSLSMTHFKNYLNLSLTVIDVSVFFPFAEYGMSCCVLNDKLYMVGGQTSRTDVFNLITGEWHRTKDCNTKRMEAQVKRYGPYSMMAL